MRSTSAALNLGLLDLSRAIGLLQHPKLGQQFSKPKQYVRWFLNSQGPGLLEWSFLVRAGYFYVLERYGKAILNCTEALRIQPRWAHAMLHRAFYKCHIDSADLAMCDLNEAINTDPSCYLIFYNRACCHEMLHDRHAAIQVCLKPPHARFVLHFTDTTMVYASKKAFLSTFMSYIVPPTSFIL
ncbi:unnamed protein product [Dibothriocephalus latus]|uniref:Uncharacterized protein n=1 Tax=Dibothriocephalus latus TaxID=60516 RepID=A0A3P6TC41_DIBLA|nr:unnamed protein product [Dibothriocephalus latus]